MKTPTGTRKGAEKLFSAELKEFISYLSDNTAHLPFRINDISKDLHLPFATVKNYLDLVKDAFALFGQLQTEALNVTRISISDLQLLCDFSQLSGLHAIPKNRFPPPLMSLKSRYSRFFCEDQGLWCASEEARHYADQYYSYKKINMVPDRLDYKGRALVVIR